MSATTLCGMQGRPAAEPAVLVALPGEEQRAARIARALPRASVAALHLRRFPDGETYVRFDSPVAGRPVVLVCSLHQADEKLVPLLLVAATARDLGAASVTLLAPYLGYMRQDARFHAGEGITSLYVGRLLSAAVDRLVTVDPHLHRHERLDDVYSVPCDVLSAAPDLGAWVRANVPGAFLVGPDAESAQWVHAAAGVGAPDPLPHVVFEKTRHGDHDVVIEVPDLAPYAGLVPVLVDDVVSTGRTMIEAARHLADAGFPPPVCAAVHGVFADGAETALAAAGLSTLVTCDTVPHATNRIATSALLARAL